VGLLRYEKEKKSRRGKVNFCFWVAILHRLGGRRTLEGEELSKVEGKTGTKLGRRGSKPNLEEHRGREKRGSLEEGGGSLGRNLRTYTGETRKRGKPSLG